MNCPYLALFWILLWSSKQSQMQTNQSSGLRKKQEEVGLLFYEQFWWIWSVFIMLCLEQIFFYKPVALPKTWTKLTIGIWCFSFKLNLVNWRIFSYTYLLKVVVVLLAISLMTPKLSSCSTLLSSYMIVKFNNFQKWNSRKIKK